MSEKKFTKFRKPKSSAVKTEKASDQFLSGNTDFGTDTDNTKTKSRKTNKTAEKKPAARQARAPKVKKQEEKPLKAQKSKPKKNLVLEAPTEKFGGRKKNNQESNGRKSNNRGRNQRKHLKPSVKAYFLGGLNEIGKNFTLFECQDDMIIVDCGLSFPNEDMPGIDAVIPDFTFIEKNIDKIKAMFITHGHEDHIGAVPYFLKSFNVPVYGTALTLALVEAKLKEFGLDRTSDLRVYPAGSHVKAGCFDVEFIHVNHSIADACALAIKTPAGTLVHTGDFKIDYTPCEGETTDLHRFAELGKEGVLALMADSTNAERPGYTMTEQKVNDTLEALFQKAGSKRILVATFASSVSRVQMIINCAIKYGRKVALSGRSMVNVVSIASELGYMNVPDGLIIDLSMINRYTDDQIVLITTGSQGEPMSALTRMAFAEHRQVEVGENDFIIISARPIPGNEKTIGSVIDELLKRGCEVIYESMYDLHVSGHACQEELKLIHHLTNPKYFIPVHGEQKHLRKHAQLAKAMGMDEKNIFIGDIGNCLEINENYLKKLADVPAGTQLVDGLGVGDVGSIVLRDRKLLAEDGIIIAVCTIDAVSGAIISGPDIVSRGFVYVRESEDMIENARRLAESVIEDCADSNIREWNVIKTKVKEALSRYFYEQTKRTPMILPILMEV
ncbi:MAG: RNase J family beta-CASP ribonuclease [Clostridia bacterium]|nr:RNase J family beta-CASP ribonuclease [Clostridia bacterium]